MSSGVSSLVTQMSALHVGGAEKVSLLTLLAPLKNGQIKNLGNLKQLLQAVLFAYKTMQLTLESIEQGKLSDFDPLVSDCACQMRALFVALYVKNDLSKRREQEEIRALSARLTLGIAAVQKKIDVITPKDEMRPAPRKNLSCADALVIEEVDIPVSSKLATLATMFLLTKTKGAGERMSTCDDCHKLVSGFQENTDYEAANVLIHRLDPAPQNTLEEESKREKVVTVVKAKAPNRMKSIVDAAKITLAKTSCELIQKVSRGLELDPLAKLMLGGLLKVHGRDELPCYATCQVVFKKALKAGISVLLKVRRAPHLVESLQDPYDVVLLLKPVKLSSTSTECRLVPCPPERQDSYKPLIVVEAQRSGTDTLTETTDEYVERLCNEDFMELINLNAGAHKQYSAGGIPIPVVEEAPHTAKILSKSLADFTTQALAKGCTHTSQKLMAITHIFCDTLKSQLISLGLET